MSSGRFNGNIEKNSVGILATPKGIISADISAAAVAVESGKILRVIIAVTTYLAFSDASDMPIPTITTEKALRLEPGTYLIHINGTFVRASANPTRVEILV